MLQIDNITYRIGGRTLLEGASATIPDGARVGLVGRNGTGKSTLFGIVTGTLSSENGSVQINKGAKIGQVAQEAPGTDQSLLEFVLDADKERKELLAEAETATDPDRISAIQLRLADISAHTAEARAGAILHGLGFNAEAQQRACREFSGGWRMRVALAAVLFSEPDLLLLDEPTNYLDLEGTLWLENYVSRYPYTVLLISHDRDLLNKVPNTIIHLDQGRLKTYKGNYDTFDRQRREQQALQLKLKKKQDDARRHMEAFVERFKAKASKAKQAQSRLKALERMQPIAAIVDDAIQPFSFPQPEKRLAPPIIAIENGNVGYEPEKPILTKINVSIGPEDRIGLLGANGNGKSTFAKLISDRLQLEKGKAKRAHKMDIAYFAQHQLDELVPAHSAYDHVKARMPEATEAKARARVAAMGFASNKMDTPARDLSGGEKARLLLGLATFNGAHLLILDEPTNHLDIDSREALTQAVNEYEGAVILISHDRHLLEACADRLWLVGNGTVSPYEGDLDEYRQLIVSAGKAANKSASSKDTLAGSETPQNRRKEQAEKREVLAPLKAKVKELEKQMAVLEKKIALCDEKLTLPDIFTKHPEKAAEISKMRGGFAKEFSAKEEEWLEVSSELEELS